MRHRNEPSRKHKELCTWGASQIYKHGHGDTSLEQMLPEHFKAQIQGHHRLSQMQGE